jgi:hypothetical protein
MTFNPVLAPIYFLANACKSNVVRFRRDNRWFARWLVCGLILTVGCHSRKANIWNPDGVPAPVAKMATTKPRLQPTLENRDGVYRHLSAQPLETETQRYLAIADVR